MVISCAGQQFQESDDEDTNFEFGNAPTYFVPDLTRFTRELNNPLLDQRV
jgi:hypothetical protein